MEALIENVEKLVRIHHELLAIGEKKLEPIKRGDMPALEALTREETKLIHTLQITETVRGRQVAAYLQEKGENSKEATLTEVKKFATTVEKETLEQLQDELLIVITKLKRQNQFNEQLIEESLRFVNLSLDLMVPQQEDISYKRKHDDEHDRYDRGHSLFDSKA